MASSDAQEALTINGHVINHAEVGANNSDICNGEHPGHVEPGNDSEQGVSEFDPAQLEESAVSPVLDDAAASQPVNRSKATPAERAVPTIQTATGVIAAGPPTPQVKKVLTCSVNSLRV